jgi:hypothetical protein
MLAGFGFRLRSAAKVVDDSRPSRPSLPQLYVVLLFPWSESDCMFWWGSGWARDADSSEDEGDGDAEGGPREKSSPGRPQQKPLSGALPHPSLSGRSSCLDSLPAIDAGDAGAGWRSRCRCHPAIDAGRPAISLSMPAPAGDLAIDAGRDGRRSRYQWTRFPLPLGSILSSSRRSRREEHSTEEV